MRSGSAKQWLALTIACAAVLSACTFSADGRNDSAPNADASLYLVSRFVESEPRSALVLERRAELAWPYGVPVTSGSPESELLRALQALNDGGVEAARVVADDLLPRLVERDDALFVVNSVDHRSTTGETLLAPWVSATTQALALALLDGLATRSEGELYSATSDALARAFLVPLDEGGFTRFDNDGVFFEQYPTERSSWNFEGAALAVLALADHVALRPEPELADVVDSALEWWDSNIDRFGGPVTAFGESVEAPGFALSFGPTEMLFRVGGDAVVDISAITITGAGVAPVRAVLGDDDDAESIQPIQLLIDTQHHNWTEATEVSGVPARRVEPGSGSDDQAPFRFVTPWNVIDGEVRVALDVYVATSGTASIEVFDGVGYRVLTEFEQGAGLETIEVAIPDGVFHAGASQLRDYVLFARLVTLTGLLSEVRGSASLMAAQERWMTSTELVPGAFDARALPHVEVDLADDPVLAIEPGLDSVHVEYPAIDQTADGLTLLYSAYGDDETWRIRGATSVDGGASWERTGTVIDGDDYGWRSAAFADALRDDTRGVVTVVFSADTTAPQGYDSVMLASGPSFDALGPPRVIAAVGGYDPAIWRTEDQYHLSFALVESPLTTIEHYTSDDGESWTRQHPLLSGTMSIYTQNTFLLGDIRVWVINIVQGRLSSRLFCRSVASGMLVPIDGGEVGVTDEQDPIWNQYRYGLEVVTIGDDLVSFHNGIRLDEGDGNGMIGRSRLDVSAVAVPSSCSADIAETTRPIGSLSAGRRWLRRLRRGDKNE